MRELRGRRSLSSLLLSDQERISLERNERDYQQTNLSSNANVETFDFLEGHLNFSNHYTASSVGHFNLESAV